MSEAYSSYSQPASISSRSPSCERLRVLVVVQDAGVRPAAHDRVVGNVRVVAAELVQQLRHHLVFRATGTREAHRALVRAHGDAGRLAHRVHFRARLEQAHVVQQVVERDELLRRLHAAARLRLRLQPVDPADDALIELLVHAHRVVDARAVLHQARQDVVDVGDRERVVGAVVARRSLGPGAPTVPRLARRIALAHEQHVLRLRAAGDQHRDRLGLGEAREVVEIAVGAVVIVDVAVARLLGHRRQDRDAALAHQSSSAGGGGDGTRLCACSVDGISSGGKDRAGRRRRRRAARSARRGSAARRRARIRRSPRTPALLPRHPSPVSTDAWLMCVRSRSTSSTSPLSCSRGTAPPVPKPYRNPWHHCDSAIARSTSGASSSGNSGSKLHLVAAQRAHGVGEQQTQRRALVARILACVRHELIEPALHAGTAAWCTGRRTGSRDFPPPPPTTAASAVRAQPQEK